LQRVAAQLNLVQGGFAKVPSRAPQNHTKISNLTWITWITQKELNIPVEDFLALLDAKYCLKNFIQNSKMYYFAYFFVILTHKLMPHSISEQSRQKEKINSLDLSPIEKKQTHKKHEIILNCLSK
jgi:hypothetical protein